LILIYKYNYIGHRYCNSNSND